MSSLPKIDLTKYTHHLTGLNKKIKFTTFTVKEQKILLNAKEEGTVEAQIDAIKQVVELCTFGQLSIDKLPFFDLEDLFLQMRIKSVSDKSTIGYEFTDPDSKEVKPVEVVVDLTQAKVVIPEDHDKVIKFNDKVGLVMRYPTINEMAEVEDQQDLILNCIESIYNGDEVLDPKDFKKEELIDWMDGFGLEELTKIKKFFDTMPKLKLDKTFKLPNGKEHTLKFEGLQSFFDYA